MSDKEKGDLTVVEKPSLVEYVEGFLPFKLPRIPLPQTAKNLDKAAAKLVLAGGDQIVAWFKRRKKINDARSQAEIDLIRAGSQIVTERISSGDEGLSERAVIAAIGEGVQAQRNRERIAQFAADELEREPGTTDATAEIDDDWLSYFSERAARVSKEEMQALWGKVLAGEIRKPGSFKLRTLQSLSVIDAEEAKLIHEHMDLVVDGKAIYAGRGRRFTSFTQLLELEGVGVVQGVGGTMSLDLPVTKDRPTILALTGKNALRITTQTGNKLRLTEVFALTPFGRELSKLAQRQEFRAGAAEDMAQLLANKGVTIELLEMENIFDGSQVRIATARRLIGPD